MANENDKVDDIEIPEEEDLEGLDDTTDWKLKAVELQKKHREAGIRNRERTKTFKDKITELEKNLSEVSKTKKDKKSDEELLKRFDTMALRIANITADDEVELFEKWKEQTGRDADAVIGNKIFQTELQDLRTAKANAVATGDVKGDGKDSGAKGDPDYWISKATKNSEGELIFPEELPKDFKLRAAIIEKIGASTKTSKEFYNSP